MDNFQCSICSKTFASPKTFEKHIKICNDVRIFKCTQCDKEVIGYIKFQNHKDVHKATCCKNCGLQIPVNSRTIHKTQCSVSQEVKLFQCDQCNYETKQKGHLKRHIPYARELLLAAFK